MQNEFKTKSAQSSLSLFFELMRNLFIFMFAFNFLIIFFISKPRSSVTFLSKYSVMGSNEYGKSIFIVHGTGLD